MERVPVIGETRTLFKTIRTPDLIVRQVKKGYVPWEDVQITSSRNSVGQKRDKTSGYRPTAEIGNVIEMINT